MGTKRITEIKIARQDVLVVRRLSGRFRPLCPVCGADGQSRTMITPAEAAAITGVSQRLVFRWIELALVHFSERGDGGLFLCASSLPAVGRSPLGSELIEPG